MHHEPVRAITTCRIMVIDHQLTILLRVKNSTTSATTSNLIATNGGSRGHGVVEGLVEKEVVESNGV
jgi:hypothetical protein